MDIRLGTHSGLLQYAFSKTVPMRANESMCGVRATFWPYGPVMNGVIWSAMTKIMLGGPLRGCWAGRCCAASGPAAAPNAGSLVNSRRVMTYSYSINAVLTIL